MMNILAFLDYKFNSCILLLTLLVMVSCNFDDDYSKHEIPFLATTDSSLVENIDTEDSIGLSRSLYFNSYTLSSSIYNDSTKLLEVLDSINRSSLITFVLTKKNGRKLPIKIRNFKFSLNAVRGDKIIKLRTLRICLNDSVQNISECSVDEEMFSTKVIRSDENIASNIILIEAQIKPDKSRDSVYLLNLDMEYNVGHRWILYKRKKVLYKYILRQKWSEFRTH